MDEPDQVRIAIVVPQVGEAIAEARLVDWLVSEGDSVKNGDVLFIVDTDKADVDIESFVDGVIDEILVQAGSPVTPGQRIGSMLVDRDHVPLDAELVDDSDQEESPEPTREEATWSEPARAPTGVSPLARRRAMDMGLDIAEVVAAVEGTVSAEDIEAFARRKELGDPESKPALSRLRRAVATSTISSKQNVPHFYVDLPVDMTAVDEHRNESSPRQTVTAYVVAACVRALESHPEWNRSLIGEVLVAHGEISVGVAVDTDEGLLVPVLSDLAGLKLEAIGGQLSAAADRAKRQKLTTSDHGPRSLVVSNLGMFGVERFHAIINQPDPFILSVGATTDQVVAIRGEVAVRPRAVLAV